MGDLEFRLGINEGPSDWLISCECPQGRVDLRVPVPFTAEELQTRLAEIEMAIVRSASRTLTRRSGQPARDFGRELTEFLLKDQVRTLFALTQEAARRQGVGVRVSLNPEGPNVSRVPWEFALEPETLDFLALRMAVARRPNLMARVEPLRVTLPLRVLVVVSRANDLPQLDVDGEQENIREALSGLSSELVQVEFMDGDRWQDLRTRLREESWHILHFIGHGGFDDALQTGYLELTDEDGSALRVQADDLARFVERNRDLRLVVLNACESAAAGKQGVFTSTAAQLLRAGVPAVVAMQYEITDLAALAFSLPFYESIARGAPVDVAVTGAREVVKVQLGSLEWATPVLFLASAQTQIFELPATRPVTPAPPPGPVPTQGGRADPVDSADPADWYAQMRTKLDVFADRVRPRGARFSQAMGLRPVSLTPPPAGPTARSGPAPAPTGSAAREPASQATRPVRSAPPSEPAADPGPEPLWASPAFGPCTHFAVGPTDLAVLAGPEGLRVMSLGSGAEVATCALPGAEPPLRVAWSPWRRYLAAAYRGGPVVVWDLASETPTQTLRPAGGVPDRVAFSHDGRFLAVTCDDRTVHVFNERGEELRVARLAEDRAAARPGRPAGEPGPTGVAFAPDDRSLLVAAADGGLRQFDVRGRLVRAWPHTLPVTAFAATGGHVATGCVGPTRIWGWDGARHQRMTGVAAEHLAFSADGTVLAAAGAAACLVWDLEGRRRWAAALAGRVAGLGFSTAGNVITASGAGVIECWPGPGGGAQA